MRELSTQHDMPPLACSREALDEPRGLQQQQQRPASIGAHARRSTTRCSNGPSCGFLALGRCRFYHPEAEEVGNEKLDGSSVNNGEEDLKRKSVRFRRGHYRRHIVTYQTELKRRYSRTLGNGVTSSVPHPVVNKESKPVFQGEVEIDEDDAANFAMLFDE